MAIAAPTRATNDSRLADGAPLVALAVIATVFLPRHYPTDLATFLRAGADLRAGYSPYPAIGTPAVYSGRAFVYPLVTAVPFTALGLLPFAVVRGVYFAAAGSAVILGCRAAGLRSGYLQALVLLSSVSITGLQAGALSPFLLAGLLFAWAYRESTVALATVLGVLVAAKLFLFPVLLWPLLTGRARAAVSAAVIAFALAAAGFVDGPIAPSDYMHLLSQLAAHEAAHGQGLIALLARNGVPLSVAQLVADGVALALIIGTALHSRSDARIFSACVLAALLTSPVLWSHYLVLAAAPVVVSELSASLVPAFCVVMWLWLRPYGTDVGALFAT